MTIIAWFADVVVTLKVDPADICDTGMQPLYLRSYFCQLLLDLYCGLTVAEVASVFWFWNCLQAQRLCPI